VISGEEKLRMEGTGSFKGHRVHQKTICKVSCQAVTNQDISGTNEPLFLFLQLLVANETGNKLVLHGIKVHSNGITGFSDFVHRPDSK
jgi:hypothetical protein